MANYGPAWNKGLSTKELGKAKPKNLVECICQQCNKSNYTFPSQIKKFCNFTCRNLYYAEDTSRRFKGKKTGRIPKSAFKKGQLSGSKHPNWRGGITNEEKLERGRFHREVQCLVFARDFYTCQICQLESGGYLQVNHIKSWKDYPELRFELDNCRTLCMACHYYVTFKRKIPAGIIWGHNLSKRIG